MATSKRSNQPSRPSRPRDAGAIALQPAQLIEMTEDQYREAVGLLATLLNSYVTRRRMADQANHADAVRREQPAGADLTTGVASRPDGNRRDLFVDAVLEWRARPNPRSVSEAQLVAIDAEIGRNAKTKERYLRAFEAGTLSDVLCGERLHALGEATETLRGRRAELAARLDAISSDESSDYLDGVDLGILLDDAKTNKGDLPVVKALFQVLIAEIRVESRDAIYPTFRVPPRLLGEDRRDPTGARSDCGPAEA